jgi:hypothetical protein
MPNSTEPTPIINDNQHGHQSETPWFDLSFEEPWYITGNRENVGANLNRDVKDGKDIIAILIRQDCNMGGQYYRYFWWIKGDPNQTRFMQVTSSWMLDSKNKGVNQIYQEQVVTICGKYRFKVSSTNCTDFIKILERVSEDE